MTSLTSSTNLNNTSDNTTANGAPKKVIAYKGTTTTGDATKDAAKYFEKGMNELAAKHGTTIERPTEENNSSEANGQSLKMISQFLTVFKRWAINIIVISLLRLFIAPITICSVSLSNALVASSKINILGL